jgi:protein-tyrosine phosphatase
MKIMFVCHGNICRSPMAEFIFKDFVKKAGREEEFYIASSAVSTEEIYRGVGNPVYPPAKAELLKHGITCEGKRAVLLKEEDGEKYDLFLCMDDSNLRRAKKILGGRYEMKCQKLLSLVGETGDVADPWYTGNFEITYKDIERAVKKLL